MENLIDNTYIANNAPEMDLSAYSATTVSGIITQASQNVISYCKVDGFLQTNVVSERDRLRIKPNGDLIISFRRRPVAQGDVAAVRLRNVGTNQSLQLNDGTNDIYFIPNPNTWMVYPSNYLISFGRGLLPLRNANMYYEVDYRGGYAPGQVPADLQEATLLYVRDIMSKRYSMFGGGNSLKQGSLQITNSNNDPSGLTAFARQARDILDNNDYVRQVP